MEAESTNAPGNFDLVAWLFENSKKVLIGVAVLLGIVLVVMLINWNKEQNEIKANEQVFTPPSIGLIKPTASADTYIKAAQDNSGNPVGERADLLAAGVLFQQNKYADAQARFEKILKDNPDSVIQSEAALGIASCLDAQGKTAEATAKYQEVVNKFANSPAASQAKLSLARINESQNKPEEALKLYEQLDKNQNPYDAWRAAAVEKRELLLAKHPELAKPEPAFQDQVIEVTTPPAGSTNAPIVKTNTVKK